MTSPDVFDLLRLPRELRDTIYKHWQVQRARAGSFKANCRNVRAEDGYVYNFEKNSLTQASGERIDLALSFTCRQVAAEIAGVAFEVNTITFRTYCSPKTVLRSAAVFNVAYEKIASQQTCLLDGLAPLLTPNIVAEAATRFPQFRPLLEIWQMDGPVLFDEPPHRYRSMQAAWGETMSTWVDFVHFALNMLATQPNFVTEAERIVASWNRPQDAVWRYNPMELIGLHPRPWAIHDLAEATKLGLVVHWDPLDLEFYSATRMICSWSAASLAIRFLKSIEATSMMRIRDVVLLEDHESIANPASHAQGLISFCRHNSKLRVERIVNLWTAGLYPNVDHRLPAYRVTDSFSRWIFETLDLQTHGMPGDAFRLTLDGNPIPEHTSRVFKVVQLDAALQAALDICYNRGTLLRPSWVERRCCSVYRWEGLPQVLQNLCTGTYSAITHCNFDLGNNLDPDMLAEERIGWSIEDWERERKSRHLGSFGTEAPLGPLPTLRPFSIMETEVLFDVLYSNGDWKIFGNDPFTSPRSTWGQSERAQTIAPMLCAPHVNSCDCFRCKGCRSAGQQR